MKQSLDSFEEVWLHDFEFQQPRGENPEPLCMVATELHSGRTIRLWRDELKESKAAALPGKAFQVAILVRLQEGINRGRDKWFKVDLKFRVIMRVSRFAWSRGLKSLKAAGLIDYMGHRGKCARIRVIEVSPHKEDAYE